VHAVGPEVGVRLTRDQFELIAAGRFVIIGGVTDNIWQQPRCTCVPVTAAGVMVPDPRCPSHGTPPFTFTVSAVGGLSDKATQASDVGLPVDGALPVRHSSAPNEADFGQRNATVAVTEHGSHEQALEALEFAHGAILDATSDEDGLDGNAGDAVLKMIRAALTANGRTPPDMPPADEPVPALPIWTANRSYPDRERLIDQAHAIEEMLREAGVGACSLTEGVRQLVERSAVPSVPMTDPPQQDWRERPIEQLRATLSMLCHFIWHRHTRPGEHMWSIPVDKERDFDCILSDAISELEHRRALSAGAVHRCSGCGLRWDGDVTGAELCGDCWRQAQPVVHAAGAVQGGHDAQDQTRRTSGVADVAPDQNSPTDGAVRASRRRADQGSDNAALYTAADIDAGLGAIYNEATLSNAQANALAQRVRALSEASRDERVAAGAVPQREPLKDYRRCGYCHCWMTKPCGEQCVWSPDGETVKQARRAAPAQRQEARISNENADRPSAGSTT
jgi:hypothetical protein